MTKSATDADNDISTSTDELNKRGVLESQHTGRTDAAQERDELETYTRVSEAANGVREQYAAAAGAADESRCASVTIAHLLIILTVK